VSLAGLAALAACALSEPRIQRIVPSQNATAVATNTEIRITFDRAIDRASVEQRLQIEPAPTGCTERCPLEWSGNSVAIQHQEPLRPSTRYTVRLLPGFLDARGQANRLDHRWTFLTEAPPTVTAIDVPPQSTRVSPARELVLTFSRPMQPDALREAVRLIPTTPLRVVANPANPAQFQVAPAQLLRARTEYALEVDFSARDVHGNVMAGNFRSTFTTGEMGFPAMLSYLAAPAGASRTRVGLVDPHSNAVTGRVLPKTIYQESGPEGAELEDFWWLPDGKSLLLQRRAGGTESGLYQFDLATGVLRDLGVRASVAALAPDGSRVAYVRAGALRTYSLADGQERVVAPEDVLALPPAFSPDSRNIAYVAGTQESLRVHVANLELGSRFRIPGVEDPTDQPVWAPDGDKLIFRRIHAGKASLWLFYLTNAPDTDKRRVADVDLDQLVWLDPTTVVGVARGDPRGPQLVRLNVFSGGAGGARLALTRPDTVPSGDEPAVPPYDRRLGFVSPVGQKSQVWVMNPDGSAALQLTFPQAGEAGHPRWTPKPRAP
jgi:hypothetical protein